MPYRTEDALGTQHVFARPPTRVVSLVPSDTLSLADLGMFESLVARTDYCELPAPRVSSVPSIGGTKNPRVDDILALQPDLVLANKEENSKGDIVRLMAAGVRVFVAFPKTLAEGVAHVAKLARIFAVERAPEVQTLMRALYEVTRDVPSPAPPLRGFCPIWMDPLMTISQDTYISDVMRAIGIQNVFGDRRRRYPLAADISGKEPWDPERAQGRDDRYPRIAWDELVQRNPEVILLPSEPHPFSDEDAARFRDLAVDAARRERVLFVDGKDLSWYGTRAATGIPRLRTQFM
jgi:ABC-type Fe3+-hydroxamate transport system substrate-binding protein